MSNQGVRNRDLPSLEPADASSTPQPTDPNTRKAREVLRLRAEGWTQKDIAREKGVSVRTVRRYEDEARRRQLVLIEEITPEQVAGDFLQSNAKLTGHLWAVFEQAISQEDGKLAAKCIRELRALNESKVAFLARLGLFEGLSLPRQAKTDPGQLGAQRLQQAIRNTLEVSDGGDNPSSQPDEKERSHV